MAFVSSTVRMLPRFWMLATDHLVNQIHAQVEGVAETGFPMDVFPERIQKIIYDLVTYENYNMEYTASIILSAPSFSLPMLQPLVIPTM